VPAERGAASSRGEAVVRRPDLRGFDEAVGNHLAAEVDVEELRIEVAGR
jgi:hypothetical protein